MSDTDKVNGSGRRAADLLDNAIKYILASCAGIVTIMAGWAILQIVAHGNVIIAQNKDIEAHDKRIKAVEDCIPKINEKLDVIREAVKK